MGCRSQMKRFEIGLILLVALPLAVIILFSVRVFNAEVENIELQKRAAMAENLRQLADIFAAHVQEISTEAGETVRAAHSQGIGEMRCLHLATECESDPNDIVRFGAVYDGYGRRHYPSSHSLEQTFIEGRYWELLSPQISNLVRSMIEARQHPDVKLRSAQALGESGGRRVMTSEGPVRCTYSPSNVFSVESSRIFCALLDMNAIQSEAIRRFKARGHQEINLQEWVSLVGPDSTVHWSSVNGQTISGSGQAELNYHKLAPPFEDLRFVAQSKGRPFDGFSAPSIGLIAIMLPGALVLVGLAVYLARARIVEVMAFRKEIERAALISHELRTPLTNIRIYLEMLKGNELSATRRAAHFGTIEDEIERLDGLIERTLAPVKGGADVEARRETIIPDDVITTLCARFAPLLDADAGRVELDLKAGEPVDLDRREFEQVVINLLDNARKHAPGSDISVSSQMDGEVLHVEVSDSKRSGDPVRVEKCKSTSETSGSHHSRTQNRIDGFGLRICREILEARGGVLKARLHSTGRKYSASFNLGRSDAGAHAS